MANKDGSSSGGSFFGAVIGATIGFFIGGPAGAVKGFMYGSTVGGLLMPPTGPDQFGPRLDSLALSTSTNVATLPRSYGTVAHKGNLIWAKDDEYVEVATVKKVKTGLFSKTKVTTYSYFFTGAYAYHKGEIEGVLRVWHAGGRDLVYNAVSSDVDTLIASGELNKYITIYKGTADQMPDPLMSEDVGAASCPAYRGIFYIVYNMYPLENYQNNIGNLDPKVEYTTKALDAPSLSLIVNVPADDVGGTQDHYARLHVLTNLDTDGAHLWRLGSGNTSGFTSSIVSNMYRAYPSGQLIEVGDLTPPLPGGEAAYNRPCAGKSDRRVMCATALYISLDGAGGSSHPYLLQESTWTVDPVQVVGWDGGAQPFYYFTGTLKGAIDSLSTYLLAGTGVFFDSFFSREPYNTRQLTILDGSEFILALEDQDGTPRHFAISSNSVELAFEGPVTEAWYAEDSSYGIALRLWVYDQDRNVVDEFRINGLSALPNPQTHYAYYKGKIYFVYVVNGIINLRIISHFADDGSTGKSEAIFSIPGMTTGATPTVTLVKIGILNDELIFVCEEAGACLLYSLPLATDLDGYGNVLTTSELTAMTAAEVLTEFGSNSSGFYNNISLDFDKMYYCLSGHIYMRKTLLGTASDLGLATGLILGTTYPAFFNIFGAGNLLAVSTYGGVMDKTGVQFFTSGITADPGKVLLSDIITAECALVGLESTDIDVTTIDQEVRGYTVSEIGSVRNPLSQLQSCFPHDIIQSGYKLKFVKRGLTSVATISWEELGQGVSLVQDREMETQLPYKVEMTYIDKDLNYQPNIQFSERPSDSKNITRLNIPIVFTPDEGAQASDILHSIYFMERRSFAFTLPPTYRNLEPSDIITLAMKDVSYVVRLTNIHYLANGSMECAAKLHSDVVYTSSAVGASSLAIPDTIPSLANPIAGIFDMPVIRDSQNTAGYTAVMSAVSNTWPGGTLFRTTDNEASWQGVAGFNEMSTWGTCSTVLAAHGGHVVDEAGTLTVKPYNGTIASVTETQFLREESLLVYGKPGRWEIIGYKTAVDNANGTYTLSYLMRGRRGTEQYTGTHETGDYLAFINDGTSKFVGASIANLDTLITNRAITTGRELGSSYNIGLNYAGVNLTPLSPVDAFAVRDGSSNLTGYFTRRSRLNDGLDMLDRMYSGVPLGEASESYEIDIMDGATVVRTITATSETFSYTAALQTTDFGSAQSSISVNIYQISATVGRGYAGAFTV